MVIILNEWYHRVWIIWNKKFESTRWISRTEAASPRNLPHPTRTLPIVYPGDEQESKAFLIETYIGEGMYTSDMTIARDANAIAHPESPRYDCIFLNNGIHLLPPFLMIFCMIMFIPITPWMEVVSDARHYRTLSQTHRPSPHRQPLSNPTHAHRHRYDDESELAHVDPKYLIPTWNILSFPLE